MRDLLYVPPGRSEASSAIGLFVPEFSNPVFAALAEAMEMHAARSGLATILCNTHGSAGRERDYVRMLLERGVEGMVFISAEITDVRGQALALREAPRARRAARVRERRLRGPRRHLGRRRRARGGTDRDRAPDRARPRAHRLRRRRRVRAADAREDAAGASTRCGRRSFGRPRRALDVHGRRRARRAARAALEVRRRAPDGGHLLERPHGDRRAAGGRGARPAGAARSLDRRLRRDRRRLVDEPAADDRRAADRRDRRAPRSRRSGARSSARPSGSRATSSGRGCAWAARRRHRRAPPRRRRSRRTARRALPAPRGTSARPSRAKTRDAASATQRSEKPSPT